MLHPFHPTNYCNLVIWYNKVWLTWREKDFGQPILTSIPATSDSLKNRNKKCTVLRSLKIRVSKHQHTRFWQPLMLFLDHTCPANIYSKRVFLHDKLLTYNLKYEFIFFSFRQSLKNSLFFPWTVFYCIVLIYNW